MSWNANPRRNNVCQSRQVLEYLYLERYKGTWETLQMYPDFKEPMSALNENQVEYIIVGAYAVAIHAQPRATRDFDILVKADAQNAQSLLAASAQFGAPLRGLSFADFADRGRSFVWATVPISIDVLTLAVKAQEVVPIQARALREASTLNPSSNRPVPLKVSYRPATGPGRPAHRFGSYSCRSECR